MRRLHSYWGLYTDNLDKVIDMRACTWTDRFTPTASKTSWSLLKRALKGTYVSVEPFHLFRYLDEQAFRFNNRAGSDAARFVLAPQRHSQQAPHLFRSYRLGVAANVLKQLPAQKTR